MSKTRRGDLAVIEEATTTSVIGGPSVTRMRYTVAVVTSVTRGGAVKAFREDAYGPDSGTVRQAAHMGPRVRFLTYPQARIDVAAAQQAARDHTWPGGQPSRPFDTLDAVRDVLRPFLRG